MAKNPDDYPKPEPGPGKADPGKIAETLDEHVHELRSGGHDAIYAALALRALRDLPEYATPSVVDGICRLIGQHVGAYQPVRTPPRLLASARPAVREPRGAGGADVPGVLRPWDHVRLVGASGVLHWITHAEALVTLEELGYKDVARHGYAAQQLNVHLRRSTTRAASPPTGLPSTGSPRPTGRAPAPRRLFHDSWLGGHAFKLPHSLLRLVRRVDDGELRRDGLRRAALLLAPFEAAAETTADQRRVQDVRGRARPR